MITRTFYAAIDPKCRRVAVVEVVGNETIACDYMTMHSAMTFAQEGLDDDVAVTVTAADKETAALIFLDGFDVEVIDPEHAGVIRAAVLG